MRLVFDLESTGLYFQATKIWCITCIDLDTEEKYTYPSEDFPTLDSILKIMKKAKELIGHNIIFYDLPVLKKLEDWEPSEECKIVDTYILSQLLNPDRRVPSGYNGKGKAHSLECWAYRLGRHKPEHEDWSQFSTEMLIRNDEDTQINCTLYRTLLREMEGWDWKLSIWIEHEFAKIIAEQEIRGIVFDVDRAIEYISDLDNKVAAIDFEILPRLPRELVKIGSVPINNPFKTNGEYRKQTLEYLEEAYPDYLISEKLILGPFNRIKFLDFDLGSVTKIKDYFLDNGWIPDVWNFSKKTGERTSPKLEGEFHGITGELPNKIKYRITCLHRRNQIQGWVNRIREDGRLSAGGVTCGTPTGRLRHYNVVNVPKANSYRKDHLEKGIITDEKLIGQLIWNTEHQKDFYGTQMRSLFLSAPDLKLIGHDASGIELRMLAHFMNSQEFINTILEGDVHEYNRELAGLPDRDSAKTFIYAFNYGAGDAKIGKIIGGGAEAGRKLKSTFFENLPELKRLIDSVRRAAGKTYLKGLDGRKLKLRRNDEGKIDRKKALNTLLQGAGAVIMKMSCILLWQKVRENNLRAYKVLDMHDEGQAEVHPDDAELYKTLAIESIREAGKFFDLRIPLDAEAKEGYNWAETH